MDNEQNVDVTRNLECGSRQLVIAAYAALLGREPDDLGLENAIRILEARVPYQELLKRILDSDEFNQKNGKLQIPRAELPDLIKLRPGKYTALGSETIFHAERDEDFDFLENAVLNHRYYDSFGVWLPSIDLDKRLIAAMVIGLGAKRSLEIGCFTGAVLRLLNERGIEATGVEISHLAFVFAYPEIRNRMVYGDLLSLNFDTEFDVVYCMDILEHLNPLKLDNYIRKIDDLLSAQGYLLINSPMFGNDDVFGTVFEAYLPEWREAGTAAFWRHVHCDDKGWPMHGHLVWGAPVWWEAQFNERGLVRDRVIERAIQTRLRSFFDRLAPARKSFFVLKKSDNATPAVSVVRNLERELSGVLGDAAL